MKATKHEKSRTQHRNVSTRHKPRARRNTTQMRRPRRSVASEFVSVVLAGSGWDPKAVANAIAAISSNDIRSMKSSEMSIAGGQLLFVWLDEPHKPSHPYASTRQTHSTIDRTIPREDVIATD